MFYVVINSKARELGGDINDGTIQLEERLTGKYSFCSFSGVHTMYNINSNNNSFILNGNTVTLDDGFYTPQELQVEIQNKVDAIIGIGLIVITYNLNTGKMTFDGTATITDMLFSNVNKTLGIYTISSTTQNYTTNILNLYPHLHIYIRLENSDINIQWKKYINASLIIHNEADFMEDIHYFPIERIPQIIDFQNVRTLRYKLLDEDGNKLNMQTDWKLVLCKI